MPPLMEKDFPESLKSSSFVVLPVLTSENSMSAATPGPLLHPTQGRSIVASVRSALMRRLSAAPLVSDTFIGPLMRSPLPGATASRALSSSTIETARLGAGPLSRSGSIMSISAGAPFRRALALMTALSGSSVMLPAASVTS